MAPAETYDSNLAWRDLIAGTRTLLEQYREAGTWGVPPGVISEPMETAGLGGAADNRALAPAAPPPVSPLVLRETLPLLDLSPAPVLVPALAEERRRRLDVLAEEVSTCTGCDLHRERTKTVFARGNPQAALCFIGEGPGADEDLQGRPFVGKAGQLLDRMISAMGLTEQDVYICNVVKCRPPQNRKPEPKEMAACMPYLMEQIALVEPTVMVALGGTAAEGLLGGRVAITRARGQWRLYRSTIPLMLTYHPAYLLRTPTAKREAWEDLKAVLEKLGRNVPERGA